MRLSNYTSFTVFGTAVVRTAVVRTALLTAAMLLISACGGGGESDGGDGGTPGAQPPGQTGPGGLEVTITSPVENQLYNQQNPRLVYSVWNNVIDAAVPDSRLAVSVHDLAGNDRVKTVDLDNPTSDSDLPVLADGQHELVMVVNDENGDPQVTVSIRFATSTAPVAEAGLNVTVHPGDSVLLSGSESYSYTGATLSYDWEIESTPQGSSAQLSDPNAVNPTIVTDREGNYIVRLTVSESGGKASDPDTVTISTTNTAPVADASIDQSVATVGETVTLDASQSFDVDGDALDYFWSFSSKPDGSQAELSDPRDPNATFVADVQGTYELALVVTDEFGSASEPVTVVVSFSNLAPVAAAATAETSVPVGDPVYLDGSGSWDANGDALTYSWSFAALPEGSSATLETTTADYTGFVPDLPGTYVVSLIVNDGLVNSTPNNVTFLAVITQDSAPIEILMEAITVIDGLADADFKNRNNRGALINKVLTVIEILDGGSIADAVEKLTSDILAKTDGCAIDGDPDRGDWLVTCSAQDQLYPLLQGALAGLAPYLEDSAGQGGQDGDQGRYHCIRRALLHSANGREFVRELLICIRERWQERHGGDDDDDDDDRDEDGDDEDDDENDDD